MKFPCLIAEILGGRKYPTVPKFLLHQPSITEWVSPVPQSTSTQSIRILKMLCRSMVNLWLIYLVGGWPTPLKKYELVKVSWDHKIPIDYGKRIQMFQTTNQWYVDWYTLIRGPRFIITGISPSYSPCSLRESSLAMEHLHECKRISCIRLLQ